MTIFQGLTQEQREFATHPNGAFVHACPGAGKTRSVIARLAHIGSTLPPRRGVAVLSFTNTAVDEFRTRCHAAGVGQLLTHPSFVGTLDAFVRRFVVLPSGMAGGAVRPIFVDSWDSLGVGIRLSGRDAFAGDAVSLDRFDPETNAIDPEVIGHTGLRNHVRAHHLRYQQEATNRRRGLIRAGYFSAGDARVVAMKLIRETNVGGALGRALAARFREVIMDEGQDCNPFDVQVLAWLRTFGVAVTFVCDPDQAIYEFRDGNPAVVQDLKQAYQDDSRLEFTGNFRSSPAICRLAATLKGANRVDQSVGDTANVEYPIALLTYGGRFPNAMIGQAFLARIVELGLPSMDAIVLAHAGSAAESAVGFATGGSDGSSRIALLARCVSELRSPAATMRSKEAAVQNVELLLAELMGVLRPGEHLLRMIERTEMDRRAHRRRAFDFLMSLPRACGDTDADRRDWVARVHAQAERLNLPLPAGVSARGFFRQPRRGEWSSHLPQTVETGLRCASVHEAKGREYGSVCVVIPPDSAPWNRGAALFQAWETRADIEAKRVIYVGVTRAQHLCALAVPAAFADRCVALLVAGQVPFTRRDL